MDIFTVLKIIAILLWVIGFIWGLIYWGNLAWRNPAKLKKESAYGFLGIEKGFMVYLWVVRIIIPLIGLGILFLIFMILLTSMDVIH